MWFDFNLKISKNICINICNIFLHIFMKEQKALENIWLTPVQSSIYISLIQNGSLSIIDISRQTWINRPSIYATLPYLQELWLVNQIIKGKRKLYKAESPDNLEHLFERTKSDFHQTVSALKSIYTSDSSRPTVTTIEWENFWKLIFEDIVNTLEKWETYMRYSSRTTQQGIEKYLAYRKTRDDKDIQRLIITGKDNAIKKPKRLNHEIRIIPEDFDLFDDNIGKAIYKDKVAILDYNTQTSFIIQNQKFADFEKKVFQLLFRYLRKN